MWSYVEAGGVCKRIAAIAVVRSVPCSTTFPRLVGSCDDLGFGSRSLLSSCDVQEVQQFMTTHCDETERCIGRGELPVGCRNLCKSNRTW